MLRPSRLYQPPKKRRRQGGGVPFDDEALIGVDARDMNGNGDNNLGWSTNDSIQATQPLVPNVGSLGGTFARAAAPGLLYTADAGDGLPSFGNVTTDANALAASSLPASAFRFLGQDGNPFSISWVYRSTVDATNQDGYFCSTGGFDVFSETGFYIAYPVGGGFPFGLFAQRVPDNDGGNSYVIDFAPPENLFFVVTYEHPGQNPGALQTLTVNGIVVDTNAVVAGGWVPGADPQWTLHFGNAPAALAPSRGQIRWCRAFASTGWAAEVFAYVTAQGLI